MKKKVILLIDDDEILASIMRAGIENDGYACVWERDGKAGLERMIEIHPDLVLLDIQMPTMDGYQVVEHVHNDPTLRNIPIIVISNSGQPVQVARILELGVKDYLIKANFSPQEVMEKVKVYIGDGEEKKSPEAPDTTTQIEHVPSFANVTPPESPEAKILIVEDDRMLSNIAVARFTKDGFHAVPAYDGEEALLKARKEMPDIILLDIIMPGIDGYEVIKILKADPVMAHIPVIFFSNLSQDSDITKGRELGAIDFIVKANTTPELLVKRVREILAK